MQHRLKHSVVVPEVNASPQKERTISIARWLITEDHRFVSARFESRDSPVESATTSIGSRTNAARDEGKETSAPGLNAESIH